MSIGLWGQKRKRKLLKPWTVTTHRQFISRGRALTAVFSGLKITRGNNGVQWLLRMFRKAFLAHSP